MPTEAAGVAPDPHSARLPLHFQRHQLVPNRVKLELLDESSFSVRMMKNSDDCRCPRQVTDSLQEPLGLATGDENHIWR